MCKAEAYMARLRSLQDAPTERKHAAKVGLARKARRREEFSRGPCILQHVLVHEITHILEGVARHSETGVMKAKWTLGDFYDMQTKTLPFASEDVDLIYRGLAQRRSRVGKATLKQ
jgi:hypothetical protein